MIQQSDYHKAFWAQVEDHYGTLVAFCKDNKISYNTGLKYMRNPRTMQVGFVQNLSRKMGKNIMPVISEGVE